MRAQEVRGENSNQRSLGEGLTISQICENMRVIPTFDFWCLPVLFALWRPLLRVRLRHEKLRGAGLLGRGLTKFLRHHFEVPRLLADCWSLPEKNQLGSSKVCLCVRACMVPCSWFVVFQGLHKVER